MYCINPDSDEPIFTLFHTIGRDDENPHDPYIDGNMFAKELLYMDGEGKKRIQIWINCEGGNVKEGMSIISAILQIKTKVDTLNIGLAYSMGGFISLMGRKREGMDYSSYMYHDPYDPTGKGANKLVEALTKSLHTTVVSRTGKSPEEVKAILGAETFYTAKEAHDAGFIDHVVNSADSNAPRKGAGTKALKAYALANIKKVLAKVPNLDQSRLDNILNKDNSSITPKIKTMKVVAQALELNDEASETAIANAIKNIQSKLTVTDKANVDLKEVNAKLEKENLDFKAKIQDAENVAAKEKEEAEKASEISAKAKFKVDAKVKIDAKIKEKGLKLADKTLENYIAMAGDNDESLKTVLETINDMEVTKVAPVINNTIAKGDPNSAIPMIKETINTQGHKVVDTKDFVAAMNSSVSKEYRDSQV